MRSEHSRRSVLNLLGAAPAPGTGITTLLADLFAPSVTLPAGEHPFGARHVSRALTMHIEPSIVLRAICSTSAGAVDVSLSGIAVTWEPSGTCHTANGRRFHLTRSLGVTHNYRVI